MRTLFAKILLWFWISIAAVAFSVLLINNIGGLQPLSRRWLSQTIDLYARSSVDFYLHGGKALLQRYLDDSAQNSGIRATLIDPQGREVLDRGLPPLTGQILQATRGDHKSHFHTGLVWTATSVVSTPQGDFIFVARIYPLRGFWAQQRVMTMLLRWSFALLAAGFLCWIIARHITAPIRALQAAARRIAAGELEARATPAIPPRNDELADLARDFDSMADRIQSLLQKQQEMLADISHELRSPLTRLSVSLELARRGEGEALERMQVDIDRVHQLIEQILTLTRLELQQNLKTENRVNLRAILESVAEDATFEGREQDKHVLVAETANCWMQGDANLLRSCMENVVRNAVRYTATHSSVEISLTVSEAGPPTATVTVTDHGPGVPEDSLSRLFEPFYRVSEARERTSGGSGLGLSIAHKVVTLHGGRIAASNRKHGGLRMEIRLPILA